MNVKRALASLGQGPTGWAVRELHLYIGFLTFFEYTLTQQLTHSSLQVHLGHKVLNWGRYIPTDDYAKTYFVTGTGLLSQ